MSLCSLRCGFLLLALSLLCPPSHPLQAQPDAWQPLTVSDSVEIAFIVYRYGDGKNAGVVLKLSNHNRTETDYRFRVIFKSGRRQYTSDPVRGVLQPFEVKTGELSGLWWIPFKDGAPVTEVGLKGLRIKVRETERSAGRMDRLP